MVLEEVRKLWLREEFEGCGSTQFSVSMMLQHSSEGPSWFLELDVLGSPTGGAQQALWSLFPQS